MTTYHTKTEASGYSILHYKDPRNKADYIVRNRESTN